MKINQQTTARAIQGLFEFTFELTSNAISSIQSNERLNYSLTKHSDFFDILMIILLSYYQGFKIYNIIEFERNGLNSHIQIP